jgi:hypothetical protein
MIALPVSKTPKALSLRALATTIDNYPEPAALLKLIEIDESLGRALVPKLEAVDFWGECISPRLRDFAYASKSRFFKDFPPRGRKVITAECFDELIAAAKASGATEEQKKLVVGLREVNVIAWGAALKKWNLTALTWLAANFPVTEENVFSMLSLACALSLDSARQIYADFRSEIDWPGQVTGSGFAFGPFFYSLAEDKLDIAAWLAAVFDFTWDVNSGRGGALFGVLCLLNNVKAVEWLVRTYEPRAGTVFDTERRGSQEWTLLLMEQSGRSALVNFFRHATTSPALRCRATSGHPLSPTSSRLAEQASAARSAAFTSSGHSGVLGDLRNIAVLRGSRDF